MNGYDLQPHGYWMNETSGVLRPVVEAYVAGMPMMENDIAAMRSYLRQWMMVGWDGDGIEDLRRRVDEITDRASLTKWLEDAVAWGIDPL